LVRSLSAVVAAARGIEAVKGGITGGGCPRAGGPGCVDLNC
jgi:hypothetical protein